MLTDTKMKAAHATRKTYRLSDTNNLYLFVTAKGRKSFRLDIAVNKVRKTFVLGQYPQISLKETGNKADDLRDDIRNGVDPSARAKIGKVTFRSLAEEWGELKVNNLGDKHASKRRLEMYA